MKKICVIGSPVAHSRSPLIHNYWLKKNNVAGEYVHAEVLAKDLPEFLNGFITNGYLGANVTIPHKEAALKYIDDVDEVAYRLQAVNTIYVKDGNLCGTNTDGEGFIENLKAQAPRWQKMDGPTVILGAGGAARAIIAALSDAGCKKINVINRTLSRAEKIAHDLGQYVQPVPWSDLSSALQDTALLVNTTSLGMEKSPPLVIPLDRLQSDAIVADIVYAPLETELLKSARAQGHDIVDGLGMLLHQAVRGFELWFGIRPEINAELRALLVADLDKS